jgi:hypothetical protein
MELAAYLPHGVPNTPHDTNHLSAAMGDGKAARSGTVASAASGGPNPHDSGWAGGLIGILVVVVTAVFVFDVPLP